MERTGPEVFRLQRIPGVDTGETAGISPTVTAQRLFTEYLMTR